jgi:hypothetical protein
MNVPSLAETKGSTPQWTKPSIRHSLQSVWPISYRHYMQSVTKFTWNSTFNLLPPFPSHFYTTRYIPNNKLNVLPSLSVFRAAIFHTSFHIKIPYEFFFSVCTTFPLFHYTRNIKEPYNDVEVTFVRLNLTGHFSPILPPFTSRGLSRRLTWSASRDEWGN